MKLSDFSHFEIHLYGRIMIASFEYYPYIQMWQHMLLSGVQAKPVAHLMQHHLLQWEVAKVRLNLQLMNSNMTLTVPNLHQKTPKGATTKIQVKDIREI